MEKPSWTCDEEYVYYDGAFRNSKSTPQDIVIEETREQILIAKPKEWKVAVENFYFDTTDSEIFTAIPRQADDNGAFPPGITIDDLNYYVQLVWVDGGGVTHTITQFLTLLTANQWNSPVTSPVRPDNHITHPWYYAIMNFGQFIASFNVAMNTADTNLRAVAGYPNPADASSPFLNLNVDTGILALVYPQTYAVNMVKIVLSASLNDMFNLPYTGTIINNVVPFFVSQNVAYEIDVGGSFINIAGLITVTTSVNFLSTTANAAQFPTSAFWPYPFFYICTDHDYRASWYDISQILVTSSIAAKEAVSTARDQPTTQGVTLPLLASFDLDLIGSAHIQGQILYSPQYRHWLNINQDSALNTLSIRFFYSDRSGRLFPIQIAQGRLAKIRLVFQRIKPKEEVVGEKRKTREDEPLGTGLKLRKI